ncbi:unnamed protein product [Scytosiphon promiscuus]
MFAWATDILGQSCMYFQRAYGRMSCRVEFTDHTRTLIFEPGLGKADEEKPPQCPCDTISIVTINISSENKHLLPCDGSCPWSRGAGVARPAEPVCSFSNGRLPEGSAELMGCMHQAACPITDNRLQMAVLRDPRAVAVSSYSTFGREYPHLLEEAQITTVEQFFHAVLPTLCKWTTVRYKLFAETLAAQSTVYWYSDTLVAPLPWHYNLLWYFGLSMPAAVVEWSSHVASKGSPALVPTEGGDKSLSLSSVVACPRREGNTLHSTFS